jgi:hypothetical protein
LFGEDNLIINDANMATRFLTATGDKYWVENLDGSKTYPTIDELLNYGNSFFGVFGTRSQLNDFENIIDIWSDFLSENDDLIANEIIKTSSKLSALIILSNFGRTIGMYANYPKSYNNLLFTEPLVAQVPEFLPLYIGALVDADENGWFNDVENFFTTGSGKNLVNEFLLIFADYSDIKKYMSQNEKNVLGDYFRNFYNGVTENYSSIRKNLENLYNDIINSNKHNRLLLFFIYKENRHENKTRFNQ